MLGISTQTEGSTFDDRKMTEKRPKKMTTENKKREAKLSRRNTVKKTENAEASKQEKVESEKRQRMLARAKSLSDLNRKFHGYSPTGIIASSENDNVSSVR